MNVLETTRLAVEDERSHHAEEYYQMELDVAEAERIRDLRSATITKRGTGTVSISEFHNTLTSSQSQKEITKIKHDDGFIIDTK